jgi:alpha-1,2-glucosyltransferase
MLYIWPYITFFSFPLLYPYTLNAILPQNLIPAPLRIGSTRPLLPRLTTTIPIVAIMLTIVHYNTLVHPFTLADNRHYTFYVFRLLLRHPAIKYLVVPIYFICAWAAIAALGGYPNSHPPPQDRKSHSKARPSPGNRVSFFLIWLLTTSLSVITAPLVEPRYFIIPWLVWRMHIPLPSKPYAYTLYLETAWFLLINWATGYIFLNWGFEWVQEPGAVQRFMW